MGRLLRLLAGNLLIALLLMLAVELIFGTWLSYDPRTKGYSCRDRYLHHAYCPGIVHRRFMAAADGGGIVDTFVDRDSIEVPDAASMAGRTPTDAYDLVLIGDSFLQAEEVPYAARIAPQLQAAGIEALQIGYSSWAPLVMRNWLARHPLRAGGQVYLLTMTNDFTPSYSHADIGYAEDAIGTENGLMVFEAPALKPATAEDGLFDYVRRNSFFWARGEIALAALRQGGQAAAAAPTGLISETAFARFEESCDPLPQYVAPGAGTPKLAADYFAFSRPRACWSDRQRAGVDRAVETLRAIAEDLAARDVGLTVMMIPAGWAFEGESLIGKTSPRYYAMAPETVVSQAGLAAAVREALTGVEVVDLEPVIRRLKQNDPEQWYFPVDGHWTAQAQARIATWLADYHRGRR